uniref:Nuclear receptor-binding factor 2 MIT domain-containing protein n=1 Tax=Marmota marmota marmota TaxID=9994 RepID=A0A8C5YMJ3_MARMA
MEVMEAPLNLAHQQSRRADRLLAAGKYEEAISCHKKAVAYLSDKGSGSKPLPHNKI